MSLQSDIEAITGSVSNMTSETLSYCKEGNRYIQRIIGKNPALSERLTQTQDITNNSGFALTNVIDIISVVREKDDSSTASRLCRRISFSDSFNALDTDSIYFATVNDPRYFIDGNTLKVLPEPTAAQKAVLRHITPNDSFSLSDSTITNLPNEYFRGVVLYAALQVLQRKMNEIDKPTGSTNLTTIDATADVNTESNRVDINKWFNIVGDYLQDEDVELASGYLQKVNTYLQAYQTELQADSSQYQWYESQYFKVSRQLVEFLTMFSAMRLQPIGVPNEAAGND